ncbi:hypothetical protein BZL29_2909 [Mycobacterium kansasii]|uniref:Uncharacterized protein n=1 Tax=Mycobacterium kansasii TaxID=1768 RepID=A0A1V3XQ91_MYCKA|nr:hypothetical protein BZL29_2909 [Mycobacterium kansasii]
MQRVRAANVSLPGTDHGIDVARIRALQTHRPAGMPWRRC